jgi:putative membrane protein
MPTAASPAARGAILDDSTRLALTRTRLSAERTLMSWIRTSFAMISFGFTIGKFLEYLSRLPANAGGRPGDVRTVPALLIVLGLVSLFIGVYEYRHTSLELAVTGGIRHRPTALGVIAVLVGLLGVLAFVGVFVRLGMP